MMVLVNLGKSLAGRQKRIFFANMCAGEVELGEFSLKDRYCSVVATIYMFLTLKSKNLGPFSGFVTLTP